MLTFKCMSWHRNGEFLKFRRLIDRSIETGKKIHIIVDNYGTQNDENGGLVGKDPRFSLHFTLTSSSWLNLVERCFRELTYKKIRRGSLTRVPDLIGAREDYIAHHNASPSHASGSIPPTRSSRRCAEGGSPFNMRPLELHHVGHACMREELVA